MKKCILAFLTGSFLTGYLFKTYLRYRLERPCLDDVLWTDEEMNQLYEGRDIKKRASIAKDNDDALRRMMNYSTDDVYKVPDVEVDYYAC